MYEEFEDTKGVVRIHKSKKDRQLITKWQTTTNKNLHLNQNFQYLVYDNTKGVKWVEHFILFSIKLLEEGLHCHLFTGTVVITSYREEGLYYHPITEPVVITLDQEQWMHYHLFTGPVVKTSKKEEGIHNHLFTGQFVNYTSTL